MVLLPVAAADTIEFETTQVTEADVALSPDGQTLIFTMLGHLFRLPVEGGTAEQLTFGPYYDTKPAVSPDGKLVAFASNRDGTDGNVFVLKLATGTVRQVTHESWAGRPTWAPDGLALVYLRFERKAWKTSGWLPPLPTVVRRIRLDGGEPETLRSEPAEVRSVFHLKDGRVGWAVVDRDMATPQATTRIEVIEPDGTVSILRTIAGVADPVVPSPEGDGLYVRRYIPIAKVWERAQQHDLLFVPLTRGKDRIVFPVSGSFNFNFSGEPWFCVSPENETLYVGNLGHLWNVSLPDGEREGIDFHAKVTLEIREPVAPPKWTPTEPGTVAAPRSIQYPRLSRDGQRVVFSAARYLWEQPLNGGPVRRLSDEPVDSDLVYSPDGRRVAFIQWEEGRESEVKVLDIESGETRTIALGDDSDADLGWSRDGQALIFTEYDVDGNTRRVELNLTDGTKKELADKAEPETIVEWPQGYAGGVVSPNERWAALVRRNQVGIWLAPLDRGRVDADDVRLLTHEGGRDFSFTVDSSELLYVVGDRLWRKPLKGGARREIPIQLALRAPAPPPLLLRRVRVLDFSTGGFGPESSLLIENGRIRWIGSGRGLVLPDGTVTLEAGGRFAIPGLFDMHDHGSACGGSGHIANGITSTRNMGGSLAGQNSHADRSAFTSDPVTRCFYAGNRLGDPNGRATWDIIHLYDEEDARENVRRLKASGAHFVKLLFYLSWPLELVVADEARRVGLPVTAHGATPEQVVKGVTQGYLGLSHANSRFYDDVLQMLAAAGTRWDLTLGWAGGGIELLLRDEPQRLRGRWDGLSHSRTLGDDALRGRWSQLLRGINAAYRRGITLLPGTDSGSWLRYHWELEFFAEAGIPPLDVLRFATQASAETVGAGDDLGTLEVGKLADIVLLDANPLEDIKNTQTIWRVIKGGWLFDPEKLRPPESVSP